MKINSIKTIKFGKYYQGKSFFGKDIKSPIEWYILDKKDNRFLLLSKYCLDKKPYNNILEDTSWENSSLRYWLNNEDEFNDSFILNAFSKEERNKIVKTKISNNGNIEFNIEGGNDTFDKIFLLNIDEFNNYLKNSGIVLAAPTDGMLNMKRLYISKDFKTNYGKGSTLWWLRNIGSTKQYAMVVTPDGSLYPHGGDVNSEIGTVRVALWAAL